MFLTVGVLLGGGLLLAQLRPPVTQTNSSGNQASPSANPTVRPSVNVFNATPTAGLARQVSEVLVTRGWEISQVGNWSGPTMKQTTIFYPTENAQAADDLADETSAVVEPATTDMSQNSLTLVLMK